MDTMLLVITVVSLAVAAVASTIAWRVTQADRRRRAARIAALTSAAGLADTTFAPSALAEALDEHAPAPDAALAPGGVAVADRFLAAGNAGSGSTGRQQRLMAAAAAMAAVVVAIAGVSFVSNRTPGRSRGGGGAARTAGPRPPAR